MAAMTLPRLNLFDRAAGSHRERGPSTPRSVATPRRRTRDRHDAANFTLECLGSVMKLSAADFTEVDGCHSTLELLAGFRQPATPARVPWHPPCVQEAPHAASFAPFHGASRGEVRCSWEADSWVPLTLPGVKVMVAVGGGFRARPLNRRSASLRP